MTSSPTFSDKIRRIVFQRSLKRRDCSHLDSIRTHEAREQSECADCLTEGTRTVHLRMCLTCGQAGCCDSSTASHARRHYEDSGHALIRSIEPGEDWVWCYVDRAYLSGVLESGPA